MKPEIEGLVNDIRDMVSDYLEQAYEMGYKDGKRDATEKIKVGDVCYYTKSIKKELFIITNIEGCIIDGCVFESEFDGIYRDGKTIHSGTISLITAVGHADSIDDFMLKGEYCCD